MQFERGWKWAATAAAVVLLAACGGGGSSAPAGSASCDVASQKDWLRGYMLDWYYWSGSSPNPDPAGYATLDAYFDALKFTSYPGPRGPIDPWSGYVDSVTYNRFFAEGRPTSILKRMIAPAEVAALVAYVCSARASATTGAALRVEGGVVSTMC